MGFPVRMLELLSITFWGLNWDWADVGHITTACGYWE